MARRPLPRILTSRTPRTPRPRGREFARSAVGNATEVLHPLITIIRGLRRMAAAGHRHWTRTPKERRGPMLFFVAACLLVISLAPFGPLCSLIALMSAAAWVGRKRVPVRATPAENARLQVLYESLVPYLTLAEDPKPIYAHGGDWQQAFPEYTFGDSGRLERLQLRYPAYFTDGETLSRGRIEHVLHAKCGRGREYLFDWDEEANRLGMTVLPALPTGICAQRFVTSPGETVLGFTDADGAPRTLPVVDGDVTRDAPPVLWRTGQRSTEAHLLAVGSPGGGTTTLLRSIALQGLRDGEALIVDGSGTSEYACLIGRAGVLAVESGLTGALATLEWASHETERRLIAVNRARQVGRPAPRDTRRQLWIVVDHPVALSHLAAAEGRADPQELLRIPLRHGRAANVTVVIAEQFDALEALSGAVRSHTGARVALGPASAALVRGVLGVPPHTTPTSEVPPGRGYARLGSGAVHRLQVPATPDPYDDQSPEAHRRAVLALLPDRTTPMAYAKGEPAAAPVES